MGFIVAYYQQQPTNEPYFVAATVNLERPGGGLLVLAGCVPKPKPKGRVPKEKHAMPSESMFLSLTTHHVAHLSLNLPHSLHNPWPNKYCSEVPYCGAFFHNEGQGCSNTVTRINPQLGHLRGAGAYLLNMMTLWYL